GDRVLIAPEEGEERTNVGLYLPPTAVETRQVQGGRIIATGPGTPMTEPASMDDEPWKIRGPDVKYLPMQAGVGDYPLFFREGEAQAPARPGRPRRGGCPGWRQDVGGGRKREGLSAPVPPCFRRGRYAGGPQHRRGPALVLGPCLPRLPVSGRAGHCPGASPG